MHIQALTQKISLITIKIYSFLFLSRKKMAESTVWRLEKYARYFIPKKGATEGEWKVRGVILLL